MAPPESISDGLLDDVGELNYFPIPPKKDLGINLVIEFFSEFLAKEVKWNRIS
jgi:hypothetical protein